MDYKTTIREKYQFTMKIIAAERELCFTIGDYETINPLTIPPLLLTVPQRLSREQFCAYFAISTFITASPTGAAASFMREKIKALFTINPSMNFWEWRRDFA